MMSKLMLAGLSLSLVAAPAAAQSAMHAKAAAPAMPTVNIVEVAASAGTFNTLLAAAKAAGLAETLAGPGPFTVFAPTDEAFAALPAGTVDALLKDPVQLKAILLYHVVSGTVMAKDVAGLTSAKTLEGGTLTINTTNGVKINDATVTKADVVASNGVIHVINKVLLPK
jgi:uncharacterized surface protein with fasciclin (FAS1) repeats